MAPVSLHSASRVFPEPVKQRRRDERGILEVGNMSGPRHENVLAADDSCHPQHFRRSSRDIFGAAHQKRARWVQTSESRGGFRTAKNHPAQRHDRLLQLRCGHSRQRVTERHGHFAGEVRARSEIERHDRIAALGAGIAPSAAMASSIWKYR